MRMWENYFNIQPAVKGSGLSGEGAMAPTRLSQADRARLMEKMKR